MSVYITRTNQKLYFARLHLDQLKHALDGKGWSKHALIESFNESVLFHLASAYRSFLGEIAEQYRTDPKKVTDLESLIAQLEAQGVETPEASELQQLAQRDSWLSGMLRAYEACWLAEERTEAQQSGHQSLSEIHVVQINPDHAEEGAVVEQLEGWLGDFQVIIERLRESMKEW